MDLSGLSTADLQAVASGDMSKVSTPALHYISGNAKTVDYQGASKPSPAQEVPGTFPYDEEKKVWDASNAQGLDYYQAKQKVLEARNKYTQNRPLGGLGENLQGASGIVAGTAMAPLGMAQEGLKKAGQSLEDRYPGMSTSLIGGALKMGGYAIPASPKQVAGNEAVGATIGYGLNKAGEVINAAGQFAKDRLPAGISKYVGIPEAITKYVQGRGTGNVFTPANLEEGAGMANVGKAASDLAESRSTVGKAIGDAEDAVLEKVGDKSAGIRHISSGIDKELFARGITDPKTASLARSKEASLLVKLSEVLKPTTSEIPDPIGLGVTKKSVQNKITVSQALKAKRLIDDNLTFADKELSKPTEQLLKKVNHQIRVAVRADLGPAVSKLWDQFGVIADAQEKLQEFTGQQVKSNTQQRAVQALHQIILKNPKEVDTIVKMVGAGLPGGEAQARQIFDSIAATPFTKGGIGAPSSIILKGASALGLTGGNAARMALKASEGMGNIPTNATYPRLKVGVSAALRALQQSRDDNGQ